jgi:hypothetical protein
MIALNEFIHWFEKEVKARWPKHDFSFTELGDWHWRLREGFDLDTLTEAVRRHKACDDWRVPGLKKVYEYAKSIQANKSPKRQRRDGDTAAASGIPEAHTYIMCVAKGDNGRGCVGWFVPILVWPFHKTYTAETYRRIAEEQCVMHSRKSRNGVWEPFYNTTHLEMLRRSNRLCGIKPLDLPAKP